MAEWDSSEWGSSEWGVGDAGGPQVSDSASIAESAILIATTAVSVADSSSVFELAIVGNSAILVDDSISTSESSIVQTQTKAFAVDSSSVSENVLLLNGVAVTPVDVVSTSEFLSISTIILVSIFDTASVSEVTSTAHPDLHVSVNDSAALSEKAYVNLATLTVQPSPTTGSGGSLRRMPARTLIVPRFRNIVRPRILG